jgi:glycosyltransferase involved in cell wall biosynthesis
LGKVTEQGEDDHLQFGDVLRTPPPEMTDASGEFAGRLREVGIRSARAAAEWITERLVEPDLPRMAIGAIDRPAPETPVETRRMRVSGWASTTNGPTESVLIEVGGIRCGALCTGLRRDDVAEATGLEWTVLSGFDGEIEVPDSVTEGPLSVEVLIAGSDRMVVASSHIDYGGPTGPAEIDGSLEYPPPGWSVTGLRLPLRGWATIGRRPAPQILAFFDGVLVGGLTTGLERSDVVDALGAETTRMSGFESEVVLPPSEGVSGELHLALAETDGRICGWLPAREVRRQRATAVRVAGQFDSPVSGEIVNAGRFRGYGWAAADDGPAAGVLVSIDGEPVVFAPSGRPRPDIARTLGSPTLSTSGFEFELDLRDFGDRDIEIGGQVVLAGEDFDRLDRLDGVKLPPVRVNVVRDAGADFDDLFEGYIDVPAGRTVDRLPVTVSGWVLAGDAAVERVEILLDGAVIGSARLGLNRTDLIDQFAEKRAPICGFTHLVDFGALPVHSTTVRVGARAVFRGGREKLVAEKSYRLAAKRPRRVTKASERRRLVLSERLDDRLRGLERPSIDALNLLAVTHHLGYGGGQLWLSELLEKAGAGRDFACTVLSPDDGPLRDDLEKLGIKVHVTSGYAADSLDGYEGRIEELAIWSRLNGFNAAIVNTTYAFIGADLARRLAMPYVWGIHESWTPREYWAIAYPPGGLDEDVRELAEGAMAEANAMVFEAEATRLQYASFAAEGRSIVVPYGIDTAKITRYISTHDRQTTRERLGFTPGDRVLLVMGTVEPRKAQTQIAEAFAEVTSRHPSSRLVLVGDMKSLYSTALHEFLIRADLGDRCQVEPIVSDPSAWYQAADVLIVASDIESLPRSVLDEMCFGRPVAATAVFGLSELLRDGETGILFPPRDYGALVDVLDRVLALPEEELLSIGQAGRRLVLENYGADAYGRDIRALLEGSLLRPEALPYELISPRGMAGKA